MKKLVHRSSLLFRGHYNLTESIRSNHIKRKVLQYHYGLKYMSRSGNVYNIIYYNGHYQTVTQLCVLHGVTEYHKF